VRKNAALRNSRRGAWFRDVMAACALSDFDAWNLEGTLMGSIRAAFLMALSAAFTAFFLWLMSRDFAWPLRGENRIWAGGALFFGAGVVLGLSRLFGARVPAPDIDGSTSIYNSRVRAIVLALGCVMVAAGALLMQPLLASARNVLAHYVVYIIVPGCALAAIIQLTQAFSGTPAYRLDASGIKVGKRFVPWSEVTGLGTFRFRSVEHAVLEISPAYRAQMTGLGRFHNLLGVPLLPGATSVSDRDLRQVVTHYWQHKHA
jgi:hypothetical protein